MIEILIKTLEWAPFDTDIVSAFPFIHSTLDNEFACLRGAGPALSGTIADI